MMKSKENKKAKFHFIGGTKMKVVQARISRTTFCFTSTPILSPHFQAQSPQSHLCDTLLHK
jgi:hypothetical protein